MHNRNSNVWFGKFQLAALNATAQIVFLLRVKNQMFLLLSWLHFYNNNIQLLWSKSMFSDQEKAKWLSLFSDLIIIV